jgi:hypothetical protein
MVDDISNERKQQMSYDRIKKVNSLHMSLTCGDNVCISIHISRGGKAIAVLCTSQGVITDRSRYSHILSQTSYYKNSKTLYFYNCIFMKEYKIRRKSYDRKSYNLPPITSSAMWFNSLPQVNQHNSALNPTEILSLLQYSLRSDA